MTSLQVPCHWACQHFIFVALRVLPLWYAKYSSIGAKTSTHQITAVVNFCLTVFGHWHFVHLKAVILKSHISSCSCHHRCHSITQGKQGERKESSTSKGYLQLKHQKKVSGNSEEMFQRVVRDEWKRLLIYLCLTFCTTQVILRTCMPTPKGTPPQ